MSYDVDRLAELREDLDRVSQRWQRTRPQTAQRGLAADGAVEVHLDGAGGVTRVVVHEGWRDTVAPDDLGAAVVRAYLSAVAASIEEWGERLVEDDDQPEPRVRPAPTMSDSFAAALQQYVDAHGSGPQVESAFDELGELLRRLLDGLDESARILQSRAQAVHTGTDARQVVRAAVQGSGELVGLEIDRAWLANRHAANITAQVTEAVADAYRQVAAALPAGSFDGTPIAEVTALLADPQALLDRLGSRERGGRR